MRFRPPAPHSTHPELRAQVDAILSQSVAERLRRLEAEAHLFASIRALD